MYVQNLHEYIEHFFVFNPYLAVPILKYVSYMQTVYGDLNIYIYGQLSVCTCVWHCYLYARVRTVNQFLYLAIGGLLITMSMPHAWP